MKYREAVINISSCKKINICNNTKCFFKQCTLGRYPFYNPLDEKAVENNNKIVKKYGDSVFPVFSATIGTNCIYVMCDMFIGNDLDAIRC